MPMDELFLKGNQEQIWQKYCGFLDLSLTEFMEIQERLLLDQIDTVSVTPLGKKFMPRKPNGISEFRQIVPLTTYDDYAPFLGEKNEDVLSEKPYCWARTSGKGGTIKWIPLTYKAVEWFLLPSVGMFIMTCTDKKGEVNICNGVRVLQNAPPPPYASGIYAPLIAEKMGMCIIPPLDKYRNVDFAERTKAGFLIALGSGVDVLSSLTSVLVKMGESFTESSGTMKFSRDMLKPTIMFRLASAWLRSKKEGRSMLPKDLWPLKGLFCFGMDTSLYKKQLIYYWGKEPLETYTATESGPIATQAWNKKHMTFIPFSCFLEFIPEDEWLKSRDNPDYQPSTVLLNEVKPDARYEIIISSFYGMPFLRYRLGDIVKIVDLEDKEAGIKIPQMVFNGRADDVIDIAGFTRLDEKTIWQSIANAGIKYEDWTARKESSQGKSILRLYIELKEDMDFRKVENLIHQELSKIDEDYNNLEEMLCIFPLAVHKLSTGSFQRYFENRRRAGADLAHLKPPHMNASDNIIHELIED